MYKMTNYAIMMKINLAMDEAELDYYYNETDPENEWFVSNTKYLTPFFQYLTEYETPRKPKVKVHQYSMGLHTLGKKGICHYHINLNVDYLPKNILANYKYWYIHKYDGVDKDLKYFKICPHSIRTTETDDLKGLLSYPYKECIDDSTSWKASYCDKVEPYSRQELINYGSGVYLASCREHQKAEEKEQRKLEKWGEFCKYMDELRDTPTIHVMGDLKGVCLIALDYFRQLPERTSVNAVITMCKDYSFKRGIWTDQQILDKYQIA